jgi:hypothetical protein
MVLAYWGIERSQEKIARQLKTIPGVGTPGFHLEKLASRDLGVLYRSGDLNDLHNALMIGVPPIILVNTEQLPYWTEATAHALVVTGISEDFALVNDPAMAQPAIKVPTGDLQLAWDEILCRYGLLQKR